MKLAHAIADSPSLPYLTTSGGQSTSHAQHDARQATTKQALGPSHVVPAPLVVVPVLPDGSPDPEHRLRGTVLGFCGGRIGLEVSCPHVVDQAEFLLAFCESTACMLVLDGPEGCPTCAGMEVASAKPRGERMWLTGELGGLAEEILQPDKLTPRYDAASMEFRFGFPESMLRKWEDLGVLQAFSPDCVQLCPRCHGLPTFRRGCRQCGSAHTTAERLIHHFACAHVDFVHHFESPTGLVCPKCRTGRLVVGADYEYLTGRHRCLECHWSDMELERVAQCLRCAFRFPEHQAYELALRGYRAHRLDLLALLPAP